jgi:uncharacterized protein YoxC
MKKIEKSAVGFLLAAILLSMVNFSASGQYTMPDVLLKSPVSEQIRYIEERTKIYENYRAIREDMFQKLTGNFSDTLAAAFREIRGLNSTVAGLRHTADSLSAALGETKTDLEAAVSTKNSIRLFGKEVNKHAYNSIMWFTIIALATILTILFLSVKRSVVVIRNKENELNELRDEFQDYRKTSREAREKMSMDHFNELRKLRGG